MVGSAKKIDGDRPPGRAIEEPKDGPLISRRFKSQRFHQKSSGVLESLDLDFYRSNPPYHAAGRIGGTGRGGGFRVCGVINQCQFQAVRIRKTQILFSERPGAAHDLDSLIHQTLAPVR